jgi:hypothetical protein
VLCQLSYSHHAHAVRRATTNDSGMGSPAVEWDYAWRSSDNSAAAIAFADSTSGPGGATKIARR